MALNGFFEKGSADFYVKNRFFNKTMKKKDLAIHILAYLSKKRYTENKHIMEQNKLFSKKHKKHPTWLAMLGASRKGYSKAVLRKLHRVLLLFSCDGDALA